MVVYQALVYACLVGCAAALAPQGLKANRLVSLQAAAGGAAADKPLLSIKIPGSASARLEVPSLATSRRLAEAVRAELRDAGGAAAIVKRSIEAQRAVVGVSLDAVRAARDGEELSAAKLARQLFERLGATYVKLGQLIASSPTVFPKEVVKEFEACLDMAPAVEFSVVKATVESAFGGRTLRELYATFDERPLATASVAQVHAATLKDGTRVVVKVQKPGVEGSLKCDLAFVSIAATVLETIAPEMNRINLADVVADLKTSVVGELDFTLEASRLTQFGTFLADKGLDGVATCPSPVLDLCRPTVLTMTRLEGRPLLDGSTNNVPGSAAAIKSEEAVANMIRVWALSVVEGPFFHADLHGGNVFLNADGRIGILDFGIVGVLPRSTYDAVLQMSAAYTARDYGQLAASLQSMGVARDTDDIGRLAKDLERVLAVDRESGGGSIAQVLVDIVDIAEVNSLRLPREFGLLTKQALYLDRYVAGLAPDLDVFSDSRILLSVGGKMPPEAPQTPEEDPPATD